MKNDLKLDKEEMQTLKRKKQELVELIADDSVYLLNVIHSEDIVCHEEHVITIKFIKFKTITEELNWQDE